MSESESEREEPTNSCSHYNVDGEPPGPSMTDMKLIDIHELSLKVLQQSYQHVTDCINQDYSSISSKVLLKANIKAAIDALSNNENKFNNEVTLVTENICNSEQFVAENNQPQQKGKKMMRKIDVTASTSGPKSGETGKNLKRINLRSHIIRTECSDRENADKTVGLSNVSEGRDVVKPVKRSQMPKTKANTNTTELKSPYSTVTAHCSHTAEELRTISDKTTPNVSVAKVETKNARKQQKSKTKSNKSQKKLAKQTKRKRHMNSITNAGEPSSRSDELSASRPVRNRVPVNHDRLSNIKLIIQARAQSSFHKDEERVAPLNKKSVSHSTPISSKSSKAGRSSERKKREVSYVDDVSTSGSDSDIDSTVKKGKFSE